MPPDDDAVPELRAIPVNDRATMRIEPAQRRREWMEPTSAGKCLPLLIANEAGWWLLNPFAVSVVWNGGERMEDLEITYLDHVPAEKLVCSNFGHGIVTWRIPFLFRTPLGWNLLARGPANVPKDGVAPLEGVIETDWSPYSFTMNWKLTRPGHAVTFAAEEPVCMVVPQRRGALESFTARTAAADEDRELVAVHHDWRRERHALHVRKFIAQHVEGLNEIRSAWQKTYFRGRLPDGSSAPEHETRLRLASFADRDD